MRKVSIINLATIICLFILLVADYNLVEARGRGISNLSI